ncbi:MAG: MATE family efflux transporter [Chitinophagaceae bacterium]|nr:MATE family efflux transporter [Chitinophagaceae bacterium]
MLTQKIKHFIQLVRQSLRGDEHDYTSGSIRQAIVLLAIPMILELSLESVFAVVDMYFVGHMPNAEVAVATVGLTESMITIIYSIAIGLSTAATAMVSRRIGEKDPEAAARAGVQSIIIGVVAALVISAIGVFFAPELLGMMGAQPEVMAEGASFTRIMLGGSTVIVLLFLINGIFRGAGDAAIAMRSLWLASGLNIVLCPLFIYGIGDWEGWGLKGAAIATTIGRGSGVLYQCWHLFKGDHMIRFKRKYLQIDMKLIRSLIGIAWPATLQFIITSGSWIVLAWIVSTTGGTTASAGYQIAIRNVVFFILPAWGLSNAAATLVGQNLGAQRPDRAKKSVFLAAQYNAIFMAFVMLLFVFFPQPIIGIFTRDAAVQEVGVRALRIIGYGYIFYGIGMVMMQALNGAGDTKSPTWISLICFWGFQVPFAYLLAKTGGMGPTGAFIAVPAAETLIALLTWWWFRRGKWSKVVV